MVEVTIRGIQEAQRANERIIAAMRPRGAFGRAIQVATSRVHRYAIAVSHVDTGAMRASHRMRLQLAQLMGIVSLDQSARNPRSGVPTHVYGYYEHERGGSHAFYARTVQEAGPRIVADAGHMIRRGLP